MALMTVTLNRIFFFRIFPNIDSNPINDPIGPINDLGQRGGNDDESINAVWASSSTPEGVFPTRTFQGSFQAGLSAAFIRVRGISSLKTLL